MQIIWIHSDTWFFLSEAECESSLCLKAYVFYLYETIPYLRFYFYRSDTPYLRHKKTSAGEAEIED
jgi:hypothetical protein